MFTSKTVMGAGSAIQRMTGVQAATNPYLAAVATAVTVADAIYRNMGSQEPRLPLANIPGGQPRAPEPQFQPSSIIDYPEEELKGEDVPLLQPAAIPRSPILQQGAVSYMERPLISIEFINQDISRSQEELKAMHDSLPKNQRNERVINDFFKNPTSHGTGQPRLLDQIIGDHFLTSVFGGVEGREFESLTPGNMSLLRALFNHVVLGGLQIGDSQPVNLQSSREAIVGALGRVFRNANQLIDLHQANLPPHILYLIFVIKKQPKGNQLYEFITGWFNKRLANRQRAPLETIATPGQMITSMAVHISLATHYDLFENVFVEVVDNIGVPREGNDLPTRRLGFHVVMVALSIDTIENREELVSTLLNRIRDPATFNHDELTQLLQRHGVFVDVMAALAQITDYLVRPSAEDIQAPQAEEIKLSRPPTQAQEFQLLNETTFVYDILRPRIVNIASVMNGQVAQHIVGMSVADDISVGSNRQDSFNQFLDSLVVELSERLGSESVPADAERNVGQQIFDWIDDRISNQRRGSQQESPAISLLQEPLVQERRRSQELLVPEQPEEVGQNEQIAIQRIVANIEQQPISNDLQNLSQREQIRQAVLGDERVLNDLRVYWDQNYRPNQQRMNEQRMNRALRNAFVVNMLIVGGVFTVFDSEILSLIVQTVKKLAEDGLRLLNDFKCTLPGPWNPKDQPKEPKVVIKENQTVVLPPMRFAVKKELELKRRDLEDETPIENIIKEQDSQAQVKRRGRPRKPIPTSEISTV